MKRPGDEPSPSLQPASKVRKSVTFSLPTKSPERSPASQSSVSTLSKSPACSNPSSGSNGGMTGSGPPPRLSAGRRCHSQGEASNASMASASSANSKRSILRSASASSYSANNANSNQQPSPRFTFDFVDDASSISSSRRSSPGGYHSPPNRRGNNKLSPSRLDSRYSARLPPSYGGHGHYNGASPNGHHRSYTGGSVGGDERIKRNLFGGVEDASSNNSGVQAMDESADFVEDSSNMSGANTPNSNSGTPNSQVRKGGYHRSHSTPNSASPGSNRLGRPTFSPANRSTSLSVHTSATALSSSGRSVSTFMNSSPRRRGMIHGVTSPLSGNLSHASVCSSAASSPANSSIGAVGGNNMVVDYSERGAGDRYIPSRSLSNFDFELATGNGSNIVGGGGIGGRVVDDIVDVNPSPSFGATMMGGGTVSDDTPAAAGGGGADLAAASSDDAASTDGTSERHDATNRQPLLYDALLRSELLGENIDPAAHSMQSPTGLVSSGGGSVVTPFRERSNNLRFSPNNGRGVFGTGYNAFGELDGRNAERSSIVNSFRLSPVSMSPNQRTNLGSYTERCKRKIAKVPTKVLDAPALQDDFYLNLVDWSSQNVLAVGLGSCVYLWSAATSRVTQLCDLSPTEDAVTSVSWSEGGRHLAIGSTRGDVQLWDAPAQKLVRTMQGHSARVGALSWKLSGSGAAGSSSSSLLASGSRDRLIHLRDPRSDAPYEMRLCGHKQEVCGLRWSFDERSMLASGGNDNKLLVWDVKRHAQPVHAFGDHTAAVKAIAWSPHQHGLLASGGGTADRCIRFWNCLTGHGINCIDTGSQVCNLAFSRNCNELVSTHGYSLNQIVVWKYPSMQKIATLTGHTYRVLYLALSPDGSTIVTGAGDETLRFWQVFPGPQKENKAGGLLFPAGMPGSVIR